MATYTKQVAFRLPDELVERLDAYAETLNQQTPGMRATRADAARILLERALNDVEGENKAKGKGKR